MGELLLRPAGGGWPGRCGGCRRRLGALHEGWVLLDEGWVHFGWLGPSCSTHNPWSVDPDPRGAGRLTPTRGGPASNHDHRDPAQAAVRGWWGRTCDGGAGLCRKDPGLALCGLVSTVLTLTGPASMFPAGIVEILRFLFGVQRRYAFNVSTMDTSDLPGPARPLPFVPSSTPRPPACPGLPSQRVPQKA